jgi:hypothetical protein
MKSISTNNLISVLFCFFSIFTVLFPVFFLNKLFLAVIVWFTIDNYKFYRLCTISPFLVFYIFFFGFVFSFFNDFDAALRQQYLFSVFVLFLIYPIIQYKIDVDHIIKISGLVAVTYTGFSFLIVIIFIDSPFSGPYYEFFRYFSAGSYGFKEYTEVGSLFFHIGCLPFLYLPFVLFVISFVEKRKLSSLLAMLVILITILVSGSRGSILSSLIAAFYIIFSKIKVKFKFIFLAASILLVFILFSYLSLNTNIFDNEEGSNAAKIAHFESFVDNLDFFNFFLGEGLGSLYYSKGSQGLKAVTEITPLDMLRYFGFILTPLLYIYLIFPTRKIALYLGNNSLYLGLLIIYILNSLTNPTMFNSFGLLVVLWYWSKILANKRTRTIDKIKYLN